MGTRPRGARAPGGPDRRSIADARATCESRALPSGVPSAARGRPVWQPAELPSEARRIIIARALRGFADGCVSLLLPAHLLALGHDARALGALSTAALLGSALATLGVGLLAGRLPVRGVLLGGALLMAATGVGFVGASGFAALLVIAFVGTLNPSGGDVSLFVPVEHALLARVAPEARRTSVFARYATAGALAAALGALAAGLPDLLAALGVASHAWLLRAGF